MDPNTLLADQLRLTWTNGHWMLYRRPTRDGWRLAQSAGAVEYTDFFSEKG